MMVLWQLVTESKLDVDALVLLLTGMRRPDIDARYMTAKNKTSKGSNTQR
jgi:hypothetical protein